ncbi:gag-pol polyprotein, partial [Tanacetum coccineum]
SISSSTAPFDLVHSDVWGPAPVSTKGGFRYYVSFIDEFTRYTWVYMMKRRSDFLTVYKEFRALVKTQHSAAIKCVRCYLGEPTPIVSPITPEPASETTSETIITTKTPPVIISEATPTVTQPPPTTTQPSSEVASVPPANVAMAEELAALHQTQTWDLVPLSVGKRAIGSRWVYKIKTKSDGFIERYKARLVAKGYAEEYGMDYEKTFAPVAKMTTIRTFIAVASSRKWKIFQLDVKNAFLNG